MGTTSNRWLGLAYRWLMPLALVAAIGVAAVTMISARSSDSGNRHVSQAFSEGDEQSEEHECEGNGYGKLRGTFGSLAELVGTDVDGLKTALSEGQTLAQVAEANGIEAQTVIDALVEKVNARIDSAAEAGKLTEEEAETKKSEAETKIEDLVNNGFDMDGHQGREKSGWRGHGQGFGGSVDHN